MIEKRLLCFEKYKMKRTKLKYLNYRYPYSAFNPSWRDRLTQLGSGFFGSLDGKENSFLLKMVSVLNKYRYLCWCTCCWLVACIYIMVWRNSVVCKFSPILQTSIRSTPNAEWPAPVSMFFTCHISDVCGDRDSPVQTPCFSPPRGFCGLGDLVLPRHIQKVC